MSGTGICRCGHLRMVHSRNGDHCSGIIKKQECQVLGGTVMTTNNRRYAGERCIFSESGNFYHAYGKSCAGANAVVSTVDRAKARGLRSHTCVGADPIWI